MSYQSLYIDFLIQADKKSAHGLSEKTKMEYQNLLERIVIADFMGTAMTVSQAMRLSHIASPSTLHRRLDFLQSEKLIDLVFHGINRRTKYLVPLPKTDRYLAHMGQLIQEAVHRDQRKMAMKKPPDLVV
jgi:hypothetical protein